MIPLSSNAFSVDDQTADVLSYLSLTSILSGDLEAKFNILFPEYNTLIWSGSWVDTEESDVDPDYMSWVRDWIEQNLPVMWEEGEPWLLEPGEFEDTDTEDEE